MLGSQTLWLLHPMKTGTLHTSYNEGGLSMLGWHCTNVHEIPGQGFQCAVMRDQEWQSSYSYFQLTRGYYQSTGALVGETMVGLQRVGQIHSCKKTIIPIIQIVCDRLTPLIGTPCMKSISTDEWKKNGNQTWKIPNSTLQWSFSHQFTSMVSGISQRPPGAPHETLQGRWSPARAPRCQCCWKNHPPGETRGNLVGFPWNTVNHGIGMIRMG